MASYFLDTSALARRYLPHEVGAPRVVTLCLPESGHRIAIARIAVAEIASALSRQQRSGLLSAQAARLAWTDFAFDVDYQYEVSEIESRFVDSAADLVFRRQLRAYDAVHLAVAVTLHAAAPEVGLHFVTADRRQAEAASAEGLSVELIA